MGVIEEAHNTSPPADLSTWLAASVIVPTRVRNHEVLKQKTSPVLPAHLMESEATAGTLNGHIMNTYLTSVLRSATASSKSDNVGAVKLNHVP